MQGTFKICISKSHISGFKERDHMTISVDAKKAVGKLQYPFMLKAMNKLGMKTIDNIILTEDNFKVFPPKSGGDQDFHILYSYLM